MSITSNDLQAFGGVDKTIKGSGRSSIKEGGAMAGFPASCIVYAGAISGSVDANGISLSKPRIGGGKGTFIRNKDDRVTFGRFKTGGFLVSDQFGGCDMTILKAPDGSFWGAHVYSSDACRADVANRPAGWSEVGTWSSAGYADSHADCAALFVFTFFEGGKAVVMTVGGGGYPITVRHVDVAATFDLT